MNSGPDTGHRFRFYATAYLISLAAVFVASLFPEARLWGIGTWARHDLFAPAVACGMALLLFGFVYRASRYSPTDDAASGPFTAVAVTVTVALAALFALFHARVHFLGDGYTVLANLAADNPIIKQRSLGESYLHLWLKKLIGDEGREAALLSFRIISVAAGVILSAMTFFAATRLFESTRHRILFALGILTGGYMLLFFGYVENYSLFVLSVGAFTLTGLFVAREYCNRFWILIPMVAAILFHVFGLLLIPAAVYLLLAPTRLGRTFRRATMTTRWLLLSLLLAGGGAAVWYLGAKNIFIRYSLMPVLHDPTFGAGYTLFSPAHLLDMVNLAWILLPGILLLPVALYLKGSTLRTRPVSFLVVLTLSTWAAVFLLDPKLGMPRDWDLFAFSGIPLTGLCYYLLLVGEAPRTRIALLAVALAAISLVPRVIQINSADIGAVRFSDYLDIDPHQDRNGPYSLFHYYLDRGDSTRADSVQAVWKQRFPEIGEIDTARAMIKKGNVIGATRHLEALTANYPDYSDAWLNLGECYFRMGSYKKSVEALSMGLGLNPFHAGAYGSRATCYMHLGEYEKALEDIHKAREILPDNPGFLINLGGIYSRQGRIAEAEGVLKEAATHKATELVAHFSLVQLYAQMGRKKPAEAELKAAIADGLDSGRVQQLLNTYPILSGSKGSRAH